MRDAMNCRGGEQAEESFDLAFVRADFGTRCCLIP
jgi:hypothetical protein